jgi:16S rRNA (guanine527-N7)-methyltransferase
MNDEPAFAPSLGELARRFSLSDEQIGRLGRFAAILVNDEHAPTTVRRPERVRDDHLADALVALEIPAVRVASSIADLGAGAGVPGIPLAIALPEARVTLIESNGRKCEFMSAAAGAIGLDNVEVVHGRAETWLDGLRRFDVVTARALAPLDVVAEYAAPLLRVGGALVAWRGEREPDVEADGARASELLGLAIAEPVRVEPYPGVENRYLHVMSKVMDTPARFPRRDGVARKRPLGRA